MGDVSSKVLEYEVKYSVLSFVGKLETTVSIFDLMVGYQFSISATSEDKDNHVLRSKISTSESKGKYKCTFSKDTL